jgi:hypothetical protein
MQYEWIDNEGVKHMRVWSKAVRNATLRGGAEFQRQKALNRAANNWNRVFLRSTYIGNVGGLQEDSVPQCCTELGKRLAQELKVT